MAETLVAFGRFLGSVTLAGVMLLSPLLLGAQENPVAAGLASANPAGTPETHAWWRGITGSVLNLRCWDSRRFMSPE